jgi:hypothetical protein
MIKALVFMKRRADLSEADVIQHYEHVHVPIVRKVFPQIGKYVRNYFKLAEESPRQHESGAHSGEAPQPYFDIVTEIWFANSADYASFVEKMQDPELARILATDEAKFLDRSVAQVFMVTERESSPI